MERSVQSAAQHGKARQGRAGQGRARAYGTVRERVENRIEYSRVE